MPLTFELHAFINKIKNNSMPLWNTKIYVFFPEPHYFVILIVTLFNLADEEEEQNFGLYTTKKCT